MNCNARCAELCAGVLRRFGRMMRGCLLVGLAGLARHGSAVETFNSIYISEVLVENRHVGSNGGGNDFGWIELYNGGSETVNLGAWHLSDTATNLPRWRF